MGAYSKTCSLPFGQLGIDNANTRRVSLSMQSIQWRDGAVNFNNFNGLEIEIMIGVPDVLSIVSTLNIFI